MSVRNEAGHLNHLVAVFLCVPDPDLLICVYDGLGSFPVGPKKKKDQSHGRDFVGPRPCDGFEILPKKTVQPTQTRQGIRLVISPHLCNQDPGNCDFWKGRAIAKLHFTLGRFFRVVRGFSCGLSRSRRFTRITDQQQPGAAEQKPASVNVDGDRRGRGEGCCCRHRALGPRSEHRIFFSGNTFGRGLTSFKRVPCFPRRLPGNCLGN